MKVNSAFCESEASVSTETSQIARGHRALSTPMSGRWENCDVILIALFPTVESSPLMTLRCEINTIRDAL